MCRGCSRDGGDRRAMARLGLSTVAAAVLVGEKRGRGWNDPLARTLQSLTVEMLLMLFSSGSSGTCVGCGGGGNGAICPNHAPGSVHVLAHSYIPRDIRSHRLWSL